MSEILDWLLPRFCLACDAAIRGTVAPFDLCAECEARLGRIDRARSCATCARPLAGKEGDGFSPLRFGEKLTATPRCGACLLDPPPWERLLPLFRYEDPFRKVMHALKFHRLEYLGPALGRALGRELRAASRDSHGAPELPDWIVPMPLPWPRRLRRGFNQTELLAEGVRRETRLPVVRALHRGLRFGSQTGRGRRERLALPGPLRGEPGGFRVFGVFGASPFRRLEGRFVLLLDDVLTTGATARAAAMALRRAGARRVDVAVAAWTPPILD